jgi:hypothetical protein
MMKMIEGDIITIGATLDDKERKTYNVRASNGKGAKKVEEKEEDDGIPVINEDGEEKIDPSKIPF